MKKSSRDYRKNNRKKWLRINTIKAQASIISLQAAFQIATIKSNVIMPRIDRYIAMIEISMNAARQLAGVISPDYKTPDLSHVESVLSELKQSKPA